MSQQNSQRTDDSLLWLLLGLLLLPLFLYAATLFYAARHLLKKLKQYQLTWASAVVALGLPALSLLVLVRLKPLPWPGLALLFPAVILGEEILILETWAFLKVWPLRKDISYYRRRVHACHAALAQLSQRKKTLQSRIQTIKAQYGKALAEQEELSEILREFCSQDVENRTVLVRSWREEESDLSARWLERQAHLAAHKADGAQQLFELMRAVRARLTKLETPLEERILTLHRWQEELKQCQREEGELGKKLFQAQQELADAKEVYRHHRTARIRLD